MKVAQKAFRLPASGAVSSSKISVMVVAIVSTSELSGVPRHAANLARCLLLQTDVSTVHLVIAPWQSAAIRSVLPLNDARLRFHEVPAGSNAFARNLWLFQRLPLLARALAVDIVHLAYPMPVRRSAFACPVVVTLHDLYPYDIPSNFGFPKVFFNRAILKQCLAAVDAVACVSESTLERLDIHAPILALQKATTIYNYIHQSSAGTCDKSVSATQKSPFLLCVAQHRRNKNVLLAMQVFECLLREGDLAAETQLIVVGIHGPETERIKKFIRRSGLTESVVLMQGISDDDLAWCYGHCELLLAPSTIEGFGYPILEAMLHHCRIVCSDIPAFREVGGSYCHYADLQLNPREAFIEASRNALQSHKFRPALTERFSGPRVSEDYLRLYKRLRGASAATMGIERTSENPEFEGGNHEQQNATT